LNDEQRAALLLREVFEWPYEDVARMLKKSSVAARQVVHRARVALQRSHPERYVDAQIAKRFVEAIRDDDACGALELLYAADTAA
jgi:RNA polymerase sigma-70 factor (ECF subfamily)